MVKNPIDKLVLELLTHKTKVLVLDYMATVPKEYHDQVYTDIWFALTQGFKQGVETANKTLFYKPIEWKDE